MARRKPPAGYRFQYGDKVMRNLSKAVRVATVYYYRDPKKETVSKDSKGHFKVWGVKWDDKGGIFWYSDEMLVPASDSDEHTFHPGDSVALKLQFCKSDHPGCIISEFGDVLLKRIRGQIVQHVGKSQYEIKWSFNDNKNTIENGHKFIPWKDEYYQPEGPIRIKTDTNEHHSHAFWQSASHDQLVAEAKRRFNIGDTLRDPRPTEGYRFVLKSYDFDSGSVLSNLGEGFTWNPTYGWAEVVAKKKEDKPSVVDWNYASKEELIAEAKRRYQIGDTLVDPIDGTNFTLRSFDFNSVCQLSNTGEGFVFYKDKGWANKLGHSMSNQINDISRSTATAKIIRFMKGDHVMLSERELDRGEGLYLRYDEKKFLKGQVLSVDPGSASGLDVEILWLLPNGTERHCWHNPKKLIQWNSHRNHAMDYGEKKSETKFPIGTEVMLNQNARLGNGGVEIDGEIYSRRGVVVKVDDKNFTTLDVGIKWYDSDGSYKGASWHCSDNISKWNSHSPFAIAATNFKHGDMVMMSTMDERFKGIHENKASLVKFKYKKKGAIKRVESVESLVVWRELDGTSSQDWVPNQLLKEWDSLDWNALNYSKDSVDYQDAINAHYQGAINLRIPDPSFFPTEKFDHMTKYYEGTESKSPKKPEPEIIDGLEFQAPVIVSRKRKNKRGLVVATTKYKN